MRIGIEDLDPSLADSSSSDSPSWQFLIRLMEAYPFSKTKFFYNWMIVFLAKLGLFPFIFDLSNHPRYM
jgi:hypothetical protein